MVCHIMIKPDCRSKIIIIVRVASSDYPISYHSLVQLEESAFNQGDHIANYLLYIYSRFDIIVICNTLLSLVDLILVYMSLQCTNVTTMHQSWHSCLVPLRLVLLCMGRTWTCRLCLYHVTCNLLRLVRL